MYNHFESSKIYYIKSPEIVSQCIFWRKQEKKQTANDAIFSASKNKIIWLISFRHSLTVAREHIYFIRELFPFYANICGRLRARSNMMEMWIKTKPIQKKKKEKKKNEIKEKTGICETRPSKIQTTTYIHVQRERGRERQREKHAHVDVIVHERHTKPLEGRNRTRATIQNMEAHRIHRSEIAGKKNLTRRTWVNRSNGSKCLL